MKKAAYLIITITLVILGKWLLQGDLMSFLQWWITIACIGIIFLPITTLIFGNFHDKGYLFAKAIGLAVTGYLMWFMSSLHIMKFTTLSGFVCVVISLIFNVIIFASTQKNRKNSFAPESFRSRYSSIQKLTDTILGEELLFFGLFLLFTYIRGFKPEAYGTEKFMDYGFMTSMMRCEYMPPEDFWFSGTKLNYYYVGQYLATFLTKISRVKVSSGYNLMLMMGGAFTVVFSYSLVYNIALRFLKDRKKNGRLIPFISGLIGGAAVCLAGNMHYPVFQWLVPLVRRFFGMEAGDDHYWFPDATRYIGYHPETNDKTIHEFPAYSFVLGDLHAHVINITFVLTVLAILFAWMSERKDLQGREKPIWKDVFHPALITIAFLIGLFHTTNFWDFPIYYVVSGAVILFTNLMVYNFRGKKVVLVTALQGILIILGSELIALPFTLNFAQISTNICLTVARTPLNQLIILWGLPVTIVIAFLCYILSDYYKDRKDNLNLDERKATRVIPHFFERIAISDLYILTIGLCAIGLVLIPEIIYVEDIYSGDYKRANTMFKLTYQAFIMFGLCFGYVFIRLLSYGRTMKQRKTAALGLALFLLSLCYIQNAVNAWYGNILKPSEYEGLDATAFMETTMPDDDLAINWLNENVSGIAVVLEAPGDSYTDYERVSVMTGLPTVLGWHTHEWLWKGDTTLLDARTADIETIYTSTDDTTVRQLLKKYEVAYLYVGKLEQEKYTTINHELLKGLGNVVFLSPANQEKAYETYIVQIK